MVRGLWWWLGALALAVAVLSNRWGAALGDSLEAGQQDWLPSWLVALAALGLGLGCVVRLAWPNRWWRWAALGLYVAVAALALGVVDDRYEADYPHYPGFGRADPPGGTFVDLSASPLRTCGVRTSGEIECWGDDYGDPPRGRFVKVDIFEYVGAGTGCAVAVDGSAECWIAERSGEHWEWRPWSNDFGQTDEPVGPFVDVSVAERYACGLRKDRSVVCWGDNLGDSFGTGEVWPKGALEVPEGTFTEVHAGIPPCALRTGGELVCWSDQAHSLTDEWDARSTLFDERWVQVSPGWEQDRYHPRTYWRSKSFSSPEAFMCAIRADATLSCRRRDLGYGFGEAKFTQVDHSLGPPCALRTDRSIMCWNPHHDPAWDVLLDPPRGEFTHLAVGANHACAIRIDGTVACWGNNSEIPLKPTPCLDGCPDGDGAVRAAGPRAAPNDLRQVA